MTSVKEEVKTEDLVKLRIDKAREIIADALATAGTIPSDIKVDKSVAEEIEATLIDVNTRDVVLRLAVDLSNEERKRLSAYLYMAVDPYLNGSTNYANTLVASSAVAFLECAAYEELHGEVDEQGYDIACQTLELGLNSDCDHSLGNLLTRLVNNGIPTRIFHQSVACLSVDKCANGAGA
jgi:hypothetical protein